MPPAVPSIGRPLRRDRVDNQGVPERLPQPKVACGPDAVSADRRPASPHAADGAPRPSRHRGHDGQGSDQHRGQRCSHFVDRSRRAGHSWTEIGTALGVIKPAARRRSTGDEIREPRGSDQFTDPIAGLDAERLVAYQPGGQLLLAPVVQPGGAGQPQQPGREEYPGHDADGNDHGRRRSRSLNSRSASRTISAASVADPSRRSGASSDS